MVFIFGWWMLPIIAILLIILSPVLVFALAAGLIYSKILDQADEAKLKDIEQRYPDKVGKV